MTMRLVFDSELAVEAVSATRWRLTRPLTWTGTEGDTITVPEGFVTDFATVPRFLHWLFLPYGAYTRAAVLHDWLLHELNRWRKATADTDPEAGPPRINSRDADGMFRVAMRDLGVPWPKRWLGWTAVRWASLFSSYRSYGREFGKDAPKVLGMTLLTLCTVVIPVAAIVVLIALGFIRVITALTGGRPAVRKARRGRLARSHDSKGTDHV